MRNRILLFSGGMDSLIAWYYLGKPDALYVNLGHRYNRKEEQACLRISLETGMKIFFDRRLSLADKEMRDANIPLRNLFLCMIASYYVDTDVSEIYLITQKGEMGIPDRDMEFMRMASDLLSKLHNRCITVLTPFKEMYKSDMVNWYLENALPLEILNMTVGCFSDKEGHCGDCGACFRKYVAYKVNGIDPGYKLTDRIIQDYLERIEQYDEHRKSEILRLFGGKK